jgi:hypothetical protein
MKAVMLFIDIALALILTAIMLPIAHNAISPLTEPETWGIEAEADKTMKRLNGTTPSYSQDTLTAAEVVLTTRVAKLPQIQVNKWIVVGESGEVVIDVDSEYRPIQDQYTNSVRAAVKTDAIYKFEYDMNRNAWVLAKTA